MFAFRVFWAEQAASCAWMWWNIFHPDWAWEDDWKYWCNDTGLGTIAGVPAIGGW